MQVTELRPVADLLGGEPLEHRIPSPNAKNTAEKNIKTPWKRFLRLFRNYLVIFSERIITESSIVKFWILIGMRLKYENIGFLASQLSHLQWSLIIWVTSWGRKGSWSAGLQPLWLKWSDCYLTYISDPYFHIMIDALLVLRFMINIYTTLIYIARLSISLPKLDGLQLRLDSWAKIVLWDPQIHCKK